MFLSAFHFIGILSYSKLIAIIAGSKLNCAFQPYMLFVKYVNTSFPMNLKNKYSMA